MVGTALCAPAREAFADPQASLGLTVGAAVEDVEGPPAAFVALHLGVRGDVLFGRTGPREMGIGPYTEAATENLTRGDFGGGVAWLVPILEDVPIVVSAGAFARDARGRPWSPGVEGTVFAGSRSYNFHSMYGMAFGLFAQTRWVADQSTLDAIVGVRLDGELIALPVLLLAGMVSH